MCIRDRYTAIHFGDAEAAGEIGQRLQPRVIHRAGLRDFGGIERKDALEVRRCGVAQDHVGHVSGGSGARR